MNDPGSQASYGNAGTYAKYANIPTNSSSYFYLFPYLLLNKNSPLFISLKRLNETFPWIIKYLSNCRNEKVNHTVQHLTTLLSHMDDGYEDLFNEANAEDYISRESSCMDGLQNYFLMLQNEIFLKEETGVKITTLSRDDISDLEPNINNIFYKGPYLKVVILQKVRSRLAKH